MEAATPLRQARVAIVGDRLVIDGLVVDDECAIRLVRERVDAGEDPSAVVLDAVEIGARVLEREQAEVMARSREDLVKQFASGDGHNPLGDFKQSVVRMLQDAAQRQDGNLGRLEERLTALQVELQSLRDEREKREEVEAERERGTAKGRTFEEAVFAVLDSIASAQGDDCDAVGDLFGATRKTGDVLVEVDACRGPSRGRIVFEAKHSKLSKPKAFEQLDRAMRERDAEFAVLVVPAEESLPARTRSLHEYNGDKLLVAYDPETDDRLSLEVAYSLARARVLMSRADGDGIDAGALRDSIERTLGAMEDVRRIKQQLTGAETSIENARSIVDAMAAQVRARLGEMGDLLAQADSAQPELLP